MDGPSHLFWTWAVFKTLKEKYNKSLNIKLAVFWGIFPDLFAFGIPILLIAAELLTGQMSFSDIPGPEKIEPPQNEFASVFQSISLLYSFSHSLVIFIVFFAIITGILFLKRKISTNTTASIVPWELSGWLLHILIDIPTHSSAFYSTPFLWPVSNFKISGIAWSTPWFLALNYFAIIIVYFVYFRKNKANT